MLRVAAVQASYELMNRDATIGRVAEHKEGQMSTTPVSNAPARDETAARGGVLADPGGWKATLSIRRCG